MTSIRLVVNGQSYAGWSSVQIMRSLDQFASSFSFQYSDRWAESEQPRVFLLGAKAEVVADGQRMIVGWIDDVNFTGSTGSASGRSTTGDLVDCSAVHATGQWRQQTAKRIIADLVEPFGIEVEYDPLIVDTIKIPRFDLDYGESAHEAIDRLSRLRAMLPISTAKGSLKFIRISKTAGLRVVSLDYRDVIRREYSSSIQDRFSTYRIAAQTARSDPSENPRRASLERFEAQDPNVKRYRPLVVHSETGAKQVELQAHAQWIANQRAAKSERVTYEVVGMAAPDGKIWEPGMLVSVDDRVLDLSDVLVVASCAHRADTSSVSTELQLARVESYGTEPISEKELIQKLKRL